MIGEVIRFNPPLVLAVLAMLSVQLFKFFFAWGLYGQAEVLGQRLKDRKETVAVAESSSGGLISAALLRFDGGSKAAANAQIAIARMKHWSGHCPSSFQHKVFFLRAEVARAAGVSQPYVVRLFGSVADKVLPSTSRGVLAAGPDITALRDSAAQVNAQLVRSLQMNRTSRSPQ